VTQITALGKPELKNLLRGGASNFFICYLELVYLRPVNADWVICPFWR